jgi:dynein intermediate chain
LLKYLLIFFIISFYLGVVGSENAHNIVSVSNDGKLCTWNMNMLSNPQKTLKLTKPLPK